MKSAVLPFAGGELLSPSIVLDLGASATQLHDGEAWKTRGHDAVTLVKYPDLRVVHLVMKAGARLDDHRIRGAMVVLLLTGAVRVQVAEDIVELRPQQALALERNLPHDVVALEDSSLFVTIAWPATRDNGGSR